MTFGVCVRSEWWEPTHQAFLLFLFLLLLLTWVCPVLIRTPATPGLSHSHQPLCATAPTSARTLVAFRAWEMTFWPWDQLLV